MTAQNEQPEDDRERFHRWREHVACYLDVPPSDITVTFREWMGFGIDDWLEGACGGEPNGSHISKEEPCPA